MIPTTHTEEDLISAISRAIPTPLAYSWPSGIPSAPAAVRVAWNSETLFVRADLDDEDVTTAATGDSQHMWMLGDVFEIFLEAEGAGFYSEMHVAPGNHRLHLRFRPEDFEGLVQKTRSLSDLMVLPPGFESIVLKTPTGWAVEALIPAALVDPSGSITPESSWKASFCRYDAWSDARPPVLSSTSPHKELSFHRRHEWRPLCF
ncbi:MAG: carbohydrate-binding family 9-like protein [Terrimicrobiaceae bacterium]